MAKNDHNQDLERRLAELEKTVADQRLELEKLRESEELYREFIEETEDLVTRVDGSGLLQVITESVPCF